MNENTSSSPEPEPGLYNKTINELFKQFNSSPKGLSEATISDNQKQYGLNELTEKHISPFMKFLGFFWGPIPWMIEFAAILSAVINHWEDFWIIMALLFLNAIVGFWQEYKADDAINLLKEKLALNARALREGKWRDLPARELVPGDIVRVRLGDIVPADLKLFKGNYLNIDESSLTGESLPVEKHAEDSAYSGSVVLQGEMEGLVIGTGMNTFFGRTAKLVEEAKTTSHFQKAVIKIGDYLIALALFMIAIIFFVSFFRHESFFETLQFALVLTIAAIPVALPAVLSVTMAIGASVLAKKKAIVSKLVAIEEMAGMDILCSDKTGTITKNELTVAEIKPLSNFSEDDVLLYAALASRAEDNDPIDSAIYNHIQPSSAIQQNLNSFNITDFQPFDPVSKRTEADVSDSNAKSFKVSKGAPQVILDLLDDTQKESIAPKVNNLVEEEAKQGYRMLGVAKTDTKGQWHYAGLIPLFDPPRDDSAQTIETAQNMGVTVKMITGDHTAIGQQIAEKVHLKHPVKSVKEFLSKSDHDSVEFVQNTDGFAEVYPEHKYKIVQWFQDQKHIVGMTGDGVNDAPALKKADVGIAVDGATDAAKSAADIVLTSPGLSVIIDALQESRKIFRRMNSYAIYRITETIRVLFFITLSIIIFNFYPVTAIMIVLLAFFNDAPIMAIAFDNVKYSNSPEKWNLREVLIMSTFLGLIGVFSSFGIFYIGQHVLQLSSAELQSFVFLKLAIAGHLTIFITRTRGPFWSIKPHPAMLWSAILTKVLATFVAVYGWFIAPISWNLALMIWGYAIVAFLITDYLKIKIYGLIDHTGLRFKK